MRLADDDRARVPFALVGVLLLVGSATLTATMVTGPPSTRDREVSRAVERATAGAQTVLRDAIARAGRNAARQPVTQPANTPTGRALNGSTPFRDYLRLRIYLTARVALASVSTEVGDVRATASLSSTPTARALRRAKQRVHVEPAGESESTGVRVRVENVSIIALQNGRVTERTSYTASLVVATPALALHDRVERFETRLNRGPRRPGLGRRLTARLYPITWARGYAQYDGAPIQNVLANRHVELAANGAILREQRSAFGRSDPAGRRAMTFAASRVGLTDLLAPTKLQGERWASELLARAKGAWNARTTLPGRVGSPQRSVPTPESTMTVGVNQSADRTFYEFAGKRPAESDLEPVLDSVYSAEVRLATSVRRTKGERRPEPRRPGENWTLVDERTDTSVTVENASGKRPKIETGWHLLEVDTRRVVRTHTVVREWTRGTESHKTERQWTDVSRVAVGIAGQHASSKRAPARTIRSVHERGGVLGGPNLRGVESSAMRRLVSDRGGVDRIARLAVAGRLDADTETVSGRRPSELYEWVYRDVAELRDRIRSVSVTIPRGRLGTQRANPAAALAREVRARRGTLVGAPHTYDSVAEKARIAARAAFVESVLDRLDARAAQARKTHDGIEQALRDVDGVPTGGTREIVAARKHVDTPDRSEVPAGGPGSAVNLSVDGAPPYLTLTAVGHRQVSAVPKNQRYYPLAARNLNVFTVPYGDVADGIASALTGGGSPDRVDLRTAALALRAANRTLAERRNRTLIGRRARLQRSLAESVHSVEHHVRLKLRAAGFGLTRSERRAAVREGLERWRTTTARALAVVNGSAATAITAAVADRRPGLRRDSVRRDRVKLVVRMALTSARWKVGGPPESRVNETVAVTRGIAKRVTKKAVEAGLSRTTDAVRKRWFGKTLSVTPSGLPIVPIPGYWYATVNVWQVTIRGGYARFTVRARQGTPATPGAAVTYVRRNATVTLDVDGDGEPERVGRTERVSFETRTTVAVVVPPGRNGVGDTDGNADERSSGWSSRKCTVGCN